MVKATGWKPQPLVVCVGGPLAGVVFKLEPHQRRHVVCLRDNMGTHNVTQHVYHVDRFETPEGDVPFLRWEALTEFGAVRELLSRYSGTPR